MSCDPRGLCCKAIEQHEKDGRHWHSCPSCFVEWECSAGCQVEHDLSGPRAMATHWECERCRHRRAEALPLVGGRRLEGTLDEFERGCLVVVREQLEKYDPDTAVVRLLCNAVRLSREYSDSVRGRK